MPQYTRSNMHFDATEKQQVLSALQLVRQTLAPKLVQLNTEERKRFASVNEENKKVINKVKDYHDNDPSLSAPEVDWREFEADYEDRQFLEFVMLTLQSLNYEVESTKMMHDYDNMQDSLTDYAYAKYKAERGFAGSTHKVKELAQFFARKPRTQSPDSPEEDENTPHL